jgi:type III secretory pathway component EscR
LSKLRGAIKKQTKRAKKVFFKNAKSKRARKPSEKRIKKTKLSEVVRRRGAKEQEGDS